MFRNKEDVKHEKIIRGLSKLEDNRKCVNCGSLGPQYICTSFATFVCMTCSGIHREFNHRVKSISLSKFTPEEVAALQAGGNQRALERYFKHWDSRQHPFPESRNPDKLRDFIKAIYVDQLYAASKPPPPKKEDSDARRTSLRTSYVGSQSFDDRRPSVHKETHQRTRSADRPSYKEYDGGFSPPVRSMREILGDDLPTLRIEPMSQTGTPTIAEQQISRFGTFVGGTSTVPSSESCERTYSDSQVTTTQPYNQLTTAQQASSQVTTQPYAQQTAVQQPSSQVAIQQPYIKADTSGWATFDSAPESNSTSWQDFKQDATWTSLPWQEVKANAGPAVWPDMQGSGVSTPVLSEDVFVTVPSYSGVPSIDQPFVPDTGAVPTTSIPDRRKSINPFDAPPTESSEFEYQHPMTSSSFSPSGPVEHPHHILPQPVSYPPVPGVFSYDGYISSNMPPIDALGREFQQAAARPGNPFC